MYKKNLITDYQVPKKFISITKKYCFLIYLIRAIMFFYQKQLKSVFILSVIVPSVGMTSNDRMIDKLI